ncbi:AAA family ATPase [Moritella viscosa]|uniref:AAA family ATPase n=1 Tax=Moritella viscosa TaxID=80854 RepID=UPI0009200B08|nr:AAA family ATPase [Moritella viscosa]SGZ09423.1 ParA family protein [Moritella viscosa]
MIYVIANQKGGVGKSSVAQSLSVYLKQLDHNNSVLLIDADPQKTSAQWAEQRAENDKLTEILCIEMSGNISQTLVSLHDQYNNIVIDCGGADSKAMRSALGIADVVLVPTRPKQRDLQVTIEMSEIIDTALALNTNLKIFSVVTQCPTLPSQGYRITGAKNVLSDLDLNPLINITRNLNSWDDATENGSSVLEWTACKKGSNDANAVFTELLEKVQ